jgi:hypothetical protein
MPDSDGTEVERITRPLGEVIRDVGKAVAEGQQELDKDLYRMYRQDAGDGPIDRETPWYRFAEVEVDLELHFHTREEEEDVSRHGSDRLQQALKGKENVERTVPQYGLVATPATPSTTFSEREAGGSSRIRFRIVPVTPPAITRTDASEREDHEAGKDEDADPETR